LVITDSDCRKQFKLADSEFGLIEWINCGFDDEVLLIEVDITDSLGWLACDFKDRVTLSSIHWPKSSYMSASASGSKFEGIVTIEGGEPPPVQLFQEAEFRSKVALNWFSDREKKLSFEKELNAEDRKDNTDFKREKHAQDVESGCRTLRKVAEAAGDVSGEHFWHRAELIARRARGEGAASEHMFSRLYDLVADYGLSISRPFAALAISTILFALAYAWLGGEAWMGPIDWRSLEEGFGYSLNRTIPIGVFADDGNTWRKDLLGESGQLGAILVRLFATSQTIASAVFIYLGVMAIRRNFRIS